MRQLRRRVVIDGLAPERLGAECDECHPRGGGDRIVGKDGVDDAPEEHRTEVDGERGYGHAKQHDAGAVARGEGERHPLTLVADLRDGDKAKGLPELDQVFALGSF